MRSKKTAKNKKEQTQPGLVRGLGVRSSIALIINLCVGSGLFLVATDISRAVSSPVLVMITWLMAGAVSLMGGLIFSELGAMYPQAGGQYVYLKEAFHPMVGFLYGWTLVLVIQPGSMAAVSIAFAKFSSELIPLSSLGLKLLASALMIGLTLLNSIGIKRIAQILDLITSIKVFAILIFCIAAFAAPAKQSIPLSFTTSLDFSAFGVALIAAFWAFDGWNNLSFVAGEIIKPKKTIPIASAVGILVVTLLYAVSNLSYFRMLTADQIAHSNFVAADAVSMFAGSWAIQLMTVFVAISSLGCVNGMVLAGARVIYAMSKNKTFPPVFSKVHPKTHSPNAALVFQLLWTLVLTWTGTFDQLFTYVIFSAFLFYGLTAYGVIRLRKTNPNHERPYKVPLYPYLPVFYLLFTAAFTINALIEKPFESIAGLVLVFLGIPTYLYFNSKNHGQAIEEQHMAF